MPTPSGHPFDQRGGPEAATAAHGHQSVASIRPLQLEDRLGDEDATGASERVRECKGAAVDVDLLPGRLDLALPGKHVRGERLVDLDHVDVVDGQLVALED